MGKVCIYARVSTIDKQDYNRQISDCKTAIGNKYKPEDIEIFAEQISGYKENEFRPQLLKMLDIIEKDSKYFDAIYITEISRLGRNPSTTRTLIDDLTDKKIPIFITSINKSTLDESGERDTIMNIIIQVLMEFADSESKTMKRRTKSGLMESVKMGRIGSGRYTAYGYKKGDNKQLVICDEEAEIIKEIFDLYSKGNGFKKICGYLNEKNVPTRANKAFGTQLMKFNTHKTADQIIWSDKTVNDIVTNSIYKGHRRFKGQIFDAPAIISPELFDECNELMKSKTHRNYLTTYEYVLKDLLTCGKCGRNYFAKFKNVPGGDKVYVCSSRLRKGGNCGNVGVNITYLDSSVYDLLVASNFLTSLIEDSDKMKPTILNELSKLKIQLLTEEDNLNKQNRKISRLIELYENTDMSISDYNKRDNVNKKELSNILTKIKLINKSITENNLMLEKISNKGKDKDFIKKLSNNRIEIAAIFKQFVKRIYITKLDGDKDLLVDIVVGVGNPKSSLKLLLDLSVTRFKEKTIYTNRFLGGKFHTEYDSNGILVTPYLELQSLIKELNPDMYRVIPKENIIDLSDSLNKQTAS